MLLNPKMGAYFWFLVRIFVGGIFLYSGFMKVVLPVENFRSVLYHYPIIPHFAIPLLAHVIPWTELVFGFFLLVGYAARTSAQVIMILLTGFIVGLISARILSGEFPADCGCFGDGPIHLSGFQVLFLDSASLILMFYLARLKKFFLSLDSFFSSAQKPE